LPEPIEGDMVFVDRSPLHIIDVKQEDISPAAMLGLSTPSEWQDWLSTST
jgi:hypothetical protein